VLALARGGRSETRIDALSALVEATAARMAALHAGKGESAEWLNSLLANLWSAGLLRNLERKAHDTLASKLRYRVAARTHPDTVQRLPQWVADLRLDNFCFGSTCPLITSMDVLANDASRMILELGVSLISTDMDVQMTVALTSTVHQLLDKFQVMTKNGSDTDICVTIKKASATGIVKLEVRPKEGLLLWGLTEAPKCRMDIQLSLKGRTGLNVTVPVSNFTKVVDLMEDLLQGMLAEELIWPRFAAVNIQPPPFSAPKWRGTMQLCVLGVRGLGILSGACKGDTTLHYTCKWAGKLKRKDSELPIQQEDTVLEEMISWGDNSFEVELLQDDESIAFDVYAKNLGEKPGFFTGSKEVQLGFNKLKVLGLPEGGSILYTSGTAGEPVIKAVTPVGGSTTDIEGRTEIDVSPTPGQGEIWLPLLDAPLGDTSVLRRKSLAEDTKGAFAILIRCNVAWAEHEC